MPRHALARLTLDRNGNGGVALGRVIRGFQQAGQPIDEHLSIVKTQAINEITQMAHLNRVQTLDHFPAIGSQHVQDNPPVARVIFPARHTTLNQAIKDAGDRRGRDSQPLRQNRDARRTIRVENAHHTELLHGELGPALAQTLDSWLKLNDRPPQQINGLLRFRRACGFSS